MRYRTWVEVNTKALIRNVNVFKKLAPRSELMAIVKSNAYGHGLVGASKIFIQAGVDMLGVDSIGEAIVLRDAGIRCPIIVLGYIMLSDLSLLFKYRLAAVIYNIGALKRLGTLARRFSKPMCVHIKIETGTNRQGIAVHQIKDFAKVFHKNKFLILEGITTHFANIEDANNLSFAKLQLARMQEAIAMVRAHNLEPRYIHCAASAATIAFAQSHYNLIRPGVGLYGLWPSLVMAHMFKKIYLYPALSWKTRVAQIKLVSKGSPIGYGLTERVKKNSRIAVLPVGYFDGYDRKLSSVGEVLIRNRKAKVLGRVCMNMMMVDITNIRGVLLEDEVVLIGVAGSYEISAEIIAQKIGTINYEVVARINPLLPRVYV